MNLKDQLEDFSKNFSQKLPFLKKKKAKPEEDPDAVLDENPNAGLSTGDTGPIPGINRKWVRGGAIALVGIFLMAFWYGSSDTMKQSQDKDKQQVEQKTDLPNSDREAKRLSQTNDYETLISQDQARAAKNKNGQGGTTTQAQRQGGTTTQAQRQTAAASTAATQTPQIPRQAPQVQVAQQPVSVPAAVSAAEKAQAEEEKAVADRLKDQFAAAIAFSTGEFSTANATGNNSTAEAVNEIIGGGSGSQSAQSNATYYEPTSNTIMSGTLIPVMLLTGINTDVAGQVMAQVQTDVYDFMGTSLLIPAGSKLMGSYEQNATNGRVQVTFTTLQTPDGGSWSIGNSLVAVDGAGYMGIAGKVNRHTGRVISGGVIGSAIAALGSLAAGNTSSSDTYTAGQLASQGALSNLINVTSDMIQSSANVKETVTVQPGYQFNVYVTSNISFGD